MCGRLSQTTAAEKVSRMMEILGGVPAALGSRYNVAPTQYVYAIREIKPGEKVWSLFHWGLIPFWAKEKKIGVRMFNARAETLAEKPAFRSAFRYHRCIIPVDDFFEWQVVPGEKKKQPYEIKLPDDQPMLLAGLWECWEKDGEIVESCTIITTDSNDQLQPIHDRMPVVLKPEDVDRWLDPSENRVQGLKELLLPYPDKLVLTPIDSQILKTR